MKKILGLALALVMVVGLLPGLPVLTVSAVDKVTLDLASAASNNLSDGFDNSNSNYYVASTDATPVKFSVTGNTATLNGSIERAQTNYTALNFRDVFTATPNVDEHVTQTIKIDVMPVFDAASFQNTNYASGYFNVLTRNYGAATVTPLQNGKNARDCQDYIMYSIYCKDAEGNLAMQLYVLGFNESGAADFKKISVPNFAEKLGVAFTLTTVWHADDKVTFVCDGEELGTFDNVAYPSSSSYIFREFLSIGYNGMATKNNGSNPVSLTVSDVMIAHGHTAAPDDGNCMTAIKCTDCGAEMTAGAAQHTFSVPQKNETQHWNKCANCDITDTKVNHTFDQEETEVNGTSTLKDAATCVDNAVYYKSCVCGLVSTSETFEAANTATGNHTDADNDWESNGTHHWHTCECTAEIDKAEHTGGTASCTTQKVCETCGVSYGATLEHNFNVPQKDGTHHWNKCATCDATDTKVAHTYDKTVKNDNTLKSAATCVEDAVYYKSCTCGAVSTTETFVDAGTAAGTHVDADNKWESDATDHWHTCGCTEKFDKAAHTYDQKVKNENTLKAAATCTEDAVYYKSCVCGVVSATETFVDTDSAKGHSHGTEWKCDKDNHWHECACGDKADSAKHTEKVVNAKPATETEKGYTGDKVCSVCDYKIAEGEEIPVLEPAPTEPAPTEPAPTEPAPTTPPTTEAPTVNPETGDNGTAVYALLLAVSMMAMVALMIPDIRNKLIRK